MKERLRAIHVTVFHRQDAFADQRAGQLRLELERLVIGCVRVGGMPGETKNLAECDVDLGVLRSEPDGRTRGLLRERILLRVDEDAREPLVRFARRLEPYLTGILAHCHWPLHTGLIEGVNNHIKVIKHMA